MRRRLLEGALVAAISMAALATPVLAHGDHDARSLARNVAAGPYIISLWQVYPDAGDSMTPHVIVMFDGVAAAPAGVDVKVAVGSTPMEVRPSTTTANGWETTDGVAEGDVVTVAISDGSQAWELDPVVVPPPPTSMIPMTELIYASIFLTAATAMWVARRTTRAWRRPAVVPSVAT
jgi:hypothetical protein